MVEKSDFLAKNYTYLGHGNQAYAFLSKDGQTVLKLFKKDYFKRTPWIHVFPPIPPFRNFLLFEGEAKVQRKEKLLKGYQIAYASIREDSGLIYFHPALTEDPNLKTTLHTKFGAIPIDLNAYVFAIQIKVIPTKQELDSLLSQGKVEEAKQRLKSLLALYVRGYEKGIIDNDHNFLVNTGFFGEKAIRQDVGKIVQLPTPIDPAIIEKDLFKITNERLGVWLKKKYPQYYEALINHSLLK